MRSGAVGGCFFNNGASVQVRCCSLQSSKRVIQCSSLMVYTFWVWGRGVNHNELIITACLEKAMNEPKLDVFTVSTKNVCCCFLIYFRALFVVVCTNGNVGLSRASARKYILTISVASHPQASKTLASIPSRPCCCWCCQWNTLRPGDK